MNDEQKKERVIVSNINKKSSDKTVVVMIERQLRHPFYGKYITRSSKLHVHDEANEGQVGDLVKIAACPRHSKTKAWRLVEILQRGATETDADVGTDLDAGAET
ncbi:MAG: 30S ribosomal protein S17 [Gammaproteobacteria bacterium]|nr:30S ribosomal protein S17 [Gammaproteobacteria bacterium]